MSDIVEGQREIVARHIRGENEHDWAAVYDTLVQDDRAHYDVVPLSAVFKGIEGVRCGSKSNQNTMFPAALSANSLSLAPT